MTWLKLIGFLFIPFLILDTPPVLAKASSPKNSQQKLIEVAAAIQKYEAQLCEVEQDLNQAHSEEMAILNNLKAHNQQLLETIHYLRHATQYSPLLAMLSAAKPEDVIHSSVVLRSITPEIHHRNQQLLKKLETLSEIRTQLEAKKNQLRGITFQHHQERYKLDALLETRLQKDTHPQEQSQDQLESPHDILSLKPPVIGKLVPTYRNSNPAWASFTQGILFATPRGAHVVSPLSGIVTFAGDYADGQGKMIIIQSATSHIVLSGLGTLSCKVGHTLNAGEPIGRMPIKSFEKIKGSSVESPHLYMEVWHQEQTINPKSVLQKVRKEQ